MNGNCEEEQETILVVDDTPFNLRLVSTMLRGRGYRVEHATSGPLALEMVTTEPPDLILLDIAMPGMDGYEVCQRLKTNEHTQDIPVIFISALDEVLDKVKAFAIGGTDYITKPFQIEEVLARVKNQMALRKLQKQLQEQNARLQQEIRDRLAAEATMQRLNEELQQLNEELRLLAERDSLTQVANRRRFDDCFALEWRRMARERQSLALLLCDVDYFKPYNDTYGHRAGDECLYQIAQTLSRIVRRPADLVARYGGEEFAIILPGLTQASAEHMAEMVRIAVLELKLPHIGSAISPYVTLSVGVSSAIPQAQWPSDWLVNAADKALYRAKEQGRNCIAFQKMATPGTAESDKSL